MGLKKPIGAHNNQCTALMKSHSYNILLILQILLAVGVHAEDGGAIADQPVAKPPAEEKRPNILVFTVDDVDAQSPGFA